MNKTAIILGATGLTGSLLLERLIDDVNYKSIKLFSRKKINGLPEKVQQFIGNIVELELFKADFTADEVFCCTGTTSKKTPNKELYKNIDFGIPTKAAQLAKENNIATFLVISAMGANAKSAIFYNKTKGQMELEVLSKNIANTYILRPSIIGGNRKESRIFEKIGILVFKLLNPFMLGGLKKYRLINANTIANAMFNLANSKNEKNTIITSDKIEKIATTSKIN